MCPLEQIAEEDRTEVATIAARLRLEDEAAAQNAQEQKAFVDAAREMDLSEEYLQKAAAELQNTRILRAQQNLKRKRVTLGAAVTVIAAAGVLLLTHPAPPAPLNYTFSAQQWRLNANPETKADVTFQNVDGRSNVAVIHVDKFVPRSTDGQYFVNLDASPGVSSFSRYKTTSFFVKGLGLANVRVYLEAGPGERWRSPELHTSPDWQKQTVDLSQFEHQVRDSDTSPWHKADVSKPENINKLSFKVGTYMNSVGASGDVAIDNLEIH